jgi:uncharacterized damage-inducible protein DinB
MSTTDFIRGGLRQLHNSYDDAVADLTEEQLHWRANEHGLSAAFILWHYVRTEDNIIQFVLQGRPTVWINGGWDVKLGLHRTAQGTGMSLEDAQTLRIADKAAFLEYMGAVWKATDAYMTTMTEERLQERTTVRPLGEMAIESAIGNMCLTHGFTHLGEIAHLRGLLGLKGMGW